jgi:hypothetical protein
MASEMVADLLDLLKSTVERDANDSALQQCEERVGFTAFSLQ